jgi:hypothetical protein
MKNLMFAACVLALAAIGNCSASDPSDWEVFSSQADQFSVIFPGTPVVQNKTEKTPLGDLRLKMYIDQSGASSYTVMAMEIPKAIRQSVAEDADSTLDGVADGFLKGSGGKLISQKEVMVDGFLGREIEASFLDGASKVRCQVVLTRERIFMVAVVAPAEEDVSAETKAYFGSFKLKCVRRDV